MTHLTVRDTLTAPDGTLVPLRIVIYAFGARFLNSMHSLVSPSGDYQWYMVAECGVELPTEEFFGGPMTVFEGVTWTRNTLDDDYTPLLRELHSQVVQYVAERFPADGIRKDARAAWEDFKVTPLPVDLMDALQDDLVGSEDDEALPFDGPVVDTSYDDEADLRRAEYGVRAYDGWDHSDEERVIAMMGAEAEAPEVKTVKCRACKGKGWHYNVDAGFRCKTCEGKGKVPATSASTFAIGDTVTYGPWTGTVQEIDDYDPTHIAVRYLAEREEWLNDYQVNPVVKTAPAVSPVIEALRKLDIDSLSPMEALIALGMLKRLAGKA